MSHDASGTPTPPSSSASAGSGSQSRSRRWSPPSPDMLQDSFPGYEIQALVGHGGMGAVYRARQTTIGRIVALKVLPLELVDEEPGFAARFEQEARTLAALSHPGIVRVLNFGLSDLGLLYMVMEFVEGTDVGELLRDHQPLPQEQALSIMDQLCAALGHAHARDVIHRDIKPSNVMLDAHGKVRLMDFGLAKSVTGQNLALTRLSVVMGTPDYLAPEAMLMGHEPDARTDIFALGVMFYQLLTGRVPRGKHRPPSERNPGVDPRLDAIVHKAMAENPEARYRDAGELRHAIEEIISGPAPASSAPAEPHVPDLAEDGPASARRSARAKRAAASATRKRQIIMALAGLVAALGIAMIWKELKPAESADQPDVAPAVATTPSPEAAPITQPQPSSPAPVVTDAAPASAPANPAADPPPAPPPQEMAKPAEEGKPALKDTLMALAKSVPSLLVPDQKPAASPAAAMPPESAMTTPPPAASVAPAAPVAPATPAKPAIADAVPIPTRPSLRCRLEMWCMDGWPARTAPEHFQMPSDLGDVVQIAVNGGPMFELIMRGKIPIRSFPSQTVTVLRADGSVVSWGKPQSGTGTRTATSATATTIPGAQAGAVTRALDVVKLCCDGQRQERQFCITSAGHLVGWGAGTALSEHVDQVVAMAKDLRIADACPVDNGVLVLTTEGSVRAFSTAVTAGPACVVPADAARGVTALAADGEEAAAVLQDGTIIVWGRQGAALYAFPPKVPFKPKSLKLVPEIGLLVRGTAGEGTLIPARVFSWKGFNPTVTVDNIGWAHSHAYLQMGLDFLFRSVPGLTWAGRSYPRSYMEPLTSAPPVSSPDEGYCEKMARGCVQIAFADGCIYGLRPAMAPVAIAPAAEGTTVTTPADGESGKSSLMEERLWTDAQDRIVYARFGGIQDGSVILLIKGERRPVALTTLSAASQELAKKLQADAGRAGSLLGLIPLPKEELKQLNSEVLKVYELRSKADDRSAMITHMGLDPTTIESSVTRSLEWLKSQQNLDGTWGSTGGASHTGLVLQCFLARGESLESEDTADRVLKAADYLMEAQRKFSNRMYSRNPYEHAEVTCALAELYLLAAANGRTVPGLKESVSRAADVIANGAVVGGGWSYDLPTARYKIIKDGFVRYPLVLSNTLALCMARDMGLRLNNLGPAITSSSGYMSTVAQGNRFYYGESITCLRRLAGIHPPPPRDVETSYRSLLSLHREATTKPPDWNVNCDIAGWHANTEACFLGAQWNEAAWTYYSGQVFPLVLAAQQESGSFKAGRTNVAEKDIQDPILRQAHCTLLLQTCYRLPATK